MRSLVVCAGDEMMSELSGRPSLPSSPDHDVKPLLDEVRSLEDIPINSVAEIASSFEDLPKGLSLMGANDQSHVCAC